MQGTVAGGCPQHVKDARERMFLCTTAYKTFLGGWGQAAGRPAEVPLHGEVA